MPSSRITGLGYCLPEQIVTNDTMSSWFDTSDEWINERTGIRQRRFFTEGKETVSGMGAEAARKAMERAGKKPEDIDLVVFSTLSPDYYFPGSGVLLQRKLGLRQIGCLDLRAQCAGFIYGLSVADQYIKSGACNTILVVGAEIQSNLLEMSDRGRNMAVIFGDGAGAAVLEATNESGKGILSTHIHADGRFAEELYMPHPGSRRKPRITEEMLTNGDILPYMNGKLVFMNAVKYFPEVIREALVHNGLSEKDIDLLVPHQANLRITLAVQKELGLRDDQVISNIQKYGNTTAASIPIALTEAWEAGRVKEGDLICMAGFGSGFIWGSALLRW
jgi:3-oxoacyl-[acyl-carrier-protein] synthase-3